MSPSFFDLARALVRHTLHHSFQALFYYPRTIHHNLNPNDPFNNTQSVFTLSYASLPPPPPVHRPPPQAPASPPPHLPFPILQELAEASDPRPLQRPKLAACACPSRSVESRRRRPVRPTRRGRRRRREKIFRLLPRASSYPPDNIPRPAQDPLLDPFYVSLLVSP